MISDWNSVFQLRSQFQKAVSSPVKKWRRDKPFDYGKNRSRCAEGSSGISLEGEDCVEGRRDYVPMKRGSREENCWWWERGQLWNESDRLKRVEKLRTKLEKAEWDG